MNNHTEELRNKYIQNLPEGMTADDIKKMSDDDPLDMDYFLCLPLCRHSFIGNPTL